MYPEESITRNLINKLTLFPFTRLFHMFTYIPEELAVLVDLTTVDSRAGYPVPVFGEDTGYLVDIDLGMPPASPHRVDLTGYW